MTGDTGLRYTLHRIERSFKGGMKKNTKPSSRQNDPKKGGAGSVPTTVMVKPEVDQKNKRIKQDKVKNTTKSARRTQQPIGAFDGVKNKVNRSKKYRTGHSTAELASDGEGGFVPNCTI